MAEQGIKLEISRREAGPGVDSLGRIVQVMQVMLELDLDFANSEIT